MQKLASTSEKHYFCSRNAAKTIKACKRSTIIGTLTEWLGSGLQNRLQQFESARYLNQNPYSLTQKSRQERPPLRNAGLFFVCL